MMPCSNRKLTTRLPSRFISVGLLCLVYAVATTAFTTQKLAPRSRSEIKSPSRRRHSHDSYNDIVSEAPSASQRRHQSFAIDRRGLLRQAAATVAAFGTTTYLPTMPAHAGSLLQFPIGPGTQPLRNKYHFMRAGTSELEAEGIYSTNPLFLTNRENAMDASGVKQVMKALEQLRTETQLFPTIAYHSLAANGMDTGDLMASELHLGREKLLPEFTYLDQRGVGMWDSGDESLVKPAVWALDYLEAGKSGMGGRPPANEDGTPNETLDDQFIRLRQFISLQESRTSGDIILVIFPDGTGPALLSAMIAGIPFKDVHALEFAPGELRLDINPVSVRTLFEEKKNDPEYLAMLEDGKEKLPTLRSHKSMVGLKEQRAEEERLEIEKEYALKKKGELQREQERLQHIAQEKQIALERKQQAERERQTQKKAREEERRLLREKAAVIKDGLSESSAILGDSQRPGPSSLSADIVPAAVLTAEGLGVLGVGAGIMGIMNGGAGDDMEPASANANSDATKDPSHSRVDPLVSTPVFPTREDQSSAESSAPPTDLDSIGNVSNHTLLFGSSVPTISSNQTSLQKPTSAPVHLACSSNSSETEQGVSDGVDLDDDVIDTQLDQLAAAEQSMKDALTEASARQQAKTSSVDDNWDDGGDSWLNVLMEIRDEADEDDDYNEDNWRETAVNGDSNPQSGMDSLRTSAELW